MGWLLAAFSLDAFSAFLVAAKTKRRRRRRNNNKRERKKISKIRENKANNLLDS